MAIDSKIYEKCAEVVGLNLVGGEENTPQWEDTLDVEYLDLALDGVSLSTGETDRHYGRTRQVRNYQVARKWAGRDVRNERQISIATLEDLRLIAKALELDTILDEKSIDLGRFMSQVLAVNVLLSGVDLGDYLGPGTKLFCGEEDTGAIVDISEAHLPCKKPAFTIATSLDLDPAKLKDGFKQVAAERRGYMAAVFAPGRIALGDSVDAQLAIDHRTTRASWKPETI